MRFSHYILSLAFLLPFSNGFIAAQKEDNTAKLPIQMAIPPGAKLSIGSSEIIFSIVKEVGKPLTPTTVDSVWLNYSSIVERNSTNIICANLASGDLPAEIGIRLKVGSDVGAGHGQVGKPTTPIYLSSSPQAIITDIGSCFTGQGDNKGHLLTFSWDLLPGYDPEFLKSEQMTNLRVKVIYTINSDE